ncbi:protein tyrosine phosphatase [Cellulophaga algicola DSM 14237]|uniref:Protein tyrosine phosphatase n=1 Tax=Cellulophaga algicola (strain DSM 14237 / IC166 / ACAM 630) TaxID=688270 RepID=E6X7X1_CELAD|nr:protein-tyrosine-phosphatase [Cellulophaga algicola]ADV47564.1 protein tyrosine phosphatase [Cellulophaga algicola DSM 14237]
MIKKIFILLIVPLILSCGQKTEPKEILFVCTHGAARSPIAAAYFNKIAKEQGLNYRAVFRGTEPDSVLTNGTANGLKKDEFKISDWKPELVSENDANNAFKIITFDCELPLNVTSKKTEQWNGTPPISKDYDKARDIIKEKVNRLVETLQEQTLERK